MLQSAVQTTTHYSLSAHLSTSHECKRREILSDRAGKGAFLITSHSLTWLNPTFDEFYLTTTHYTEPYNSIKPDQCQTQRPSFFRFWKQLV